MLLLCVKIINQGTRRLKIIIESGAGLKPKNGGRRISKTGSEHEAIMDARDTYPVNTIAIIAMPKQNGKTKGIKQSSYLLVFQRPFHP